MTPTPASPTLGQASPTLRQLPPGLHGAHLRSELVAAIGLPAVRAKLRTGELVRFARHVLVERQRSLEFTTRAAATLLTAGPRSVLTSHTAAHLHGCSAADAGVIHVLTSYHRQVRRRNDLAQHQGSFEEQDVLVLDGLRVLALEQVIADLLCTAARGTALACTDQALAGLNPSLRGEFRAEVEHRIMARPDPRGRRRSRVLLDLSTGLPESPAESRVLLALFDAELPVPQPQFSVCDLDGQERYRLDFAWPEPMIGLEYDGHAAHVDRGDLDAARDSDLSKRGWIIVRATAADLRDPARMASAVRAAFARRGFIPVRADLVA